MSRLRRSNSLPNSLVSEVEEYEVPIRDTTPRRRRPGAPERPATPHHSLPDQIAASALSGTLEFLKIAGGFTLSTTGRIVAPPLHVTRTLILPNLFHAFCDYLASITPETAKDWWRILSTSFYHFFTVIGTTDRGKDAQKRLLGLGGTLVDCLSSPTFRQIIIDAVAGFVKAAKVLDTPEYEDFLNQLTLFACRFTSGQVQQLLNDSNAFFLALSKLLADPHTTMALAEVTAYMCYALERQEGRQIKRKERDTYQKKTNLERSTIHDPDSTVEQAILSSLGIDAKHDKHPEETDDTSSIFQGSIRKQVDDRSVDSSVPFHEKARGDVDVDFLKEHIVENPPLRVEVRSRPVNKEDMEDLGMEDSTIDSSRPRVPLSVPADDDEISNPKEDESEESKENGVWVEHEHPLPMEGEQPLQHFYRILDETLTRKRKEAINEVIQSNRHAPTKLLQKGVAYKKRSDNVTFKEQMDLLKAEFTTQLGVQDRKKIAKMERLVLRNKRLVYMGLVVAFFVIVLWGALGCYGLYVYFRPTLKESLESIIPTPLSQEIVIKVVREVVHVDAKGNEIRREVDRKASGKDEIASSILKGLQNMV